jgi:ATP-binding cassette subfamily F protein 3
VIEDRVLIPYLGNYTEYRTRKRPIVLDVPPAPQVKRADAGPSSTAKPAAVPPSRPGGKKSARLKVRTVEDVERDIEKAEAQVKALEDELAEAALKADAEQLTQLSAGYEQAKTRVEKLLVEWEQLAGAAS